MRPHRVLSLIVPIALLVGAGCSPTTEPGAREDATASPRAAGDASFETVVRGLDNPRGLAFAANGALYVSEAGTGGDGPCFEGPEGKSCYGLSGAVTRLWHGTQERVVTGLPSIAAPDGSGAGGPHAVSTDGPGNLHVLLGLGADPAVRDEGGALGGLDTRLGYLLHVPAGGPGRDVADVAAFEGTANPDGGELDSNPFGLLAWRGMRIVADAGANAVLAVRPDGKVTTIAAFEERLVLAPPELGLPEGAEIPMQSVPTCLAIGPDGALYVGELTGFPFPVGAARIYRVGVGGDVSIHVEGLTNVVGIAFTSGGELLALEIATNSLRSGDPTGALRLVGKEGHKVIASDGLILPGGLAIGPDGAAYVSNCGVCPGGGTVERIAF